MKLTKVQASADGIRESKLHEWIIRFVFGGLVSLTAGLISRQWGPEVGGLFLAFPSILPATVTLVKEHKNRDQAADCTRGAALGSVGLISFAAVVFLAAEHWSAVVTLTAATLAWLVTSLLVWAVLE
jgi:hypothetical protein